MIYVLYHANCYDGFGAAYAAWSKFGDEARYLPVSYGSPCPDLPHATQVFILDFSFPKDVLAKLCESTHVTVLDHHKTAYENLREFVTRPIPNMTVIFDMERSGAKIAWQFFKPYGTEACPLLIEHISDRDLWTFSIPGSREVHAALVCQPFDFKVWDQLHVPDLIIEGRACLKFQSQLVKNICEKAWIGRVGDHDVPVVNTACSWSEVGEQLLKEFPKAPFVASFTIMKNSAMWSLRSRGDFDVSEVAKKFGGGGHKAAAGFKAARI